MSQAGSNKGLFAKQQPSDSNWMSDTKVFAVNPNLNLVNPQEVVEESQNLEPTLEPRNVNVHYQVSLLTRIDTSLMVWNAQVYISGSWVVHRHETDAMSKYTKSSGGERGVARTEFERLHDWGKVNNMDFSDEEICEVRSEHKTQPVEDFLTIFNPQFYVVNLVGKRSEAVQAYTCKIEPLKKNGVPKPNKILCRFAMRILGDFATEMELHRFPWDNTALELELMTQWDHKLIRLKDQQAVEPARKNHLSKTAHKYGPVEWELYDHGLNTGGSETGAVEFDYEKVYITIYARRNAGFYLTKVFFPNYILCSTTVLSLFATTMGEQLGLILTVLLTGSAYQIVVTDAAPQGLPYNTNADWYLVMCMVWNAIILVICSTGIPYINYTPLWRLNDDELNDDYRFQHPESLQNLVAVLLGIWLLINVVWIGTSIKFSHVNIGKKWDYDVKEQQQATSSSSLVPATSNTITSATAEF